MSIIGVGTDIVKKSRMEKLWSEFGSNFAKRILTEFEQTELIKAKDSSSYLAKRFAAKEAVAKALGTGFADEVLFSEIEIYNNNKGKPKVRFIGKTKSFTETLDIKESHISISDEKEYAIAFVTLES